MTTIEMWRIGDTELNLGMVVGTTHGLSLWNDEEYGWSDYTGESLYRYQNELGIKITSVDIQDNLSYLDQYIKTEYKYTTYRSNKEGNIIEQEESFMYLPEFLGDTMSFARYGSMCYLSNDNGCFYLYLLITYVYLKYNANIEPFTILQYRIDNDNSELGIDDKISFRKTENTIIFTDYQGNEAAYTLKELERLIAIKDVEKLIEVFLKKFNSKVSK